MRKWRFEHLYLLIVTIAMIILILAFKADKDTTGILITAFIGLASGASAFVFTKHNPNKKE